MMRKVIYPACLLAILILIVETTTFFYISNEQNFHWWIDWYFKTVDVAIAFQSPQDAFRLIQQSMGEERNLIYTLPLIPFFLVFGHSRQVYFLSLALVYLVPFCLVMGGLATQLIPAKRQVVFWTTTVMTFLVPVSWIGTFLGIPDTGGASAIAFASILYLQDTKLKAWWRIPTIGFFLAFAILLRRHFIYGSLAFLIAANIHFFISILPKKRKFLNKELQNLLIYSLKISLIALTILIILFSVAGEFTYKALTINYRQLYASWSLPINNVIELYIAFYGWITLLLVAIGWSGGIIAKVVSPATSFILLQGLFSAIIWLGLLRYGNIFYSIHLTPCIVLGLVALTWTTELALKSKKQIILGLIGFCLITNLAIGLTSLGNFDNVLRPLFAINTPPINRHDYDEVLRMIDYLKQITPNKEPIYVVGTQRTKLSPRMIVVAEQITYGRDKSRLNILPSPIVNSRDYYPLEALLKAKYVLVPNSLPGTFRLYKDSAVEEWLPPKEHEVVKVVYNAFQENWEIARNFQRLPEEFNLDSGIVRIYKRIQPTSTEIAIRTLEKMKQQIIVTPGGQKKWMIINQFFPSLLTENPNKTYKFIAHLGNNRQSSNTSFLYFSPLARRIQVTGKISLLNQTCKGVKVQGIVLNKAGEVVSKVSTSYSNNFSLSVLDQREDAYLLIEFFKSNLDIKNECFVQIDELAVKNKE